MVVRRKLRVRTLALRFVSRSARNALMKGASGSSRAKADGGLMEPRLCKREQQPERVLWDAIVLALTLR
jgi:hypothetical protein